MLEQKKMWLAGVCVGILVLAGCASKAPAPVEIRAATRTADTASAPSAVARPGYYIVKKGDTLYSIAQQNGRDYRELAAWNNISDPNVIEVGQELRVQPQAAAASSASMVTRPIAPVAGIESRPVSAAASSSAASEPAAAVSATAATSGVKTEPKGGRINYSAQAWKDLTQSADKAPVTAGSAPVAQPGTQSAPVENKTTAAAEGGEWGWPGAGKVIASFNESSSKGIVLGGNLGDSVLAAGTGEVKYVGSSLRGYGNLVIIKHSNDFLSVYAHNQEILVKENQQVKKGQKIATLGKSDADRPKLHFEIRRQGKPVDPLKYLPSR